MMRVLGLEVLEALSRLVCGVCWMGLTASPPSPTHGRIFEWRGEGLLGLFCVFAGTVFSHRAHVTQPECFQPFPPSPPIAWPLPLCDSAVFK